MEHITYQNWCAIHLVKVWYASQMWDNSFTKVTTRDGLLAKSRIYSWVRFTDEHVGVRSVGFVKEYFMGKPNARFNATINKHGGQLLYED